MSICPVTLSEVEGSKRSVFSDYSSGLGIIRNQERNQFARVNLVIANSQSNPKRQLLIDLAKYTGNGKYAHLVAGK